MLSAPTMLSATIEPMHLATEFPLSALTKFCITNRDSKMHVDIRCKRFLAAVIIEDGAITNLSLTFKSIHSPDTKTSALVNIRWTATAWDFMVTDRRSGILAKKVDGDVVVTTEDSDIPMVLARSQWIEFDKVLHNVAQRLAYRISNVVKM